MEWLGLVGRQGTIEVDLDEAERRVYLCQIKCFLHFTRNLEGEGEKRHDLSEVQFLTRVTIIENFASHATVQQSVDIESDWARPEIFGHRMCQILPRLAVS